MGVILVTAALFMGFGDGIAQAPEVAARALVPILKDARANIPPRLTVEPATPRPSAITGRHSTIVAVTVGKRSVPLAEEVDEFIDRLLLWDAQNPLPPADRTVVVDWLELLRIEILERLHQPDRNAGCDNACLIEHLTEPGPIFGDSPPDQVETRNELLLHTLSAVVRD